MVRKRIDHSAVSFGNKMYVIEILHCEVYDNITKKFTISNIMKSYSKKMVLSLRALSINNKLVYFCNYSFQLSVYVYDLVEKKWLVEAYFVEDIYMNATDLCYLQYSKT